MKFDLKVIALIFFVVLVVLSSVFSKKRNANRHVAGVFIEIDENLGFLTNAIIKKSINEIEQFQNQKILLEHVQLSSIEKHLNRINGVHKAEVFLYPDGILGVSVRSRKPLFEIIDGENYFVDQYGTDIENILKVKANIPKFMGRLSPENKIEVTQLIKDLNKDDFFRKELEWVSKNDGKYQLKLKSYPFEVIMGSNDDLKNKMRKLKVFCIYYSTKLPAGDYKKISLEFINQVLVKN